MAKRLTDSRKFQDPWYRKLTPEYKLLWDYILCGCNHAGIWKVDLEMAAFCIGVPKYDIESCLIVFKDRIKTVGNEKWFIPKFISFQYGDINTNKSKACLSALKSMEKERVTELLPNSLVTIMDMDMDKNKEMNKDKERQFEALWQKYPNKDGRKSAIRHFLTSVITEQDLKDISVAMENYLKSEKVLKGYIKNGSTWFNNWKDWINLKQPKPYENVK